MVVLCQGGKIIILGNIIKINQKLEVLLSKGKHVERYQSRIEEILPDCMIIAMPMDKGYPIILSPGTTFWGKVSSDSAIFQFRSSFIDKRIISLPVWIVSHPREIKKIQQREFVRIDAILPVQLQLIEVEEDSKLAEPIFTLSRDISGGGMQVVLKTPIQIGAKVNISFTLPSFGDILAAGEVVRVDRPQYERNIFWVAIKFTGLHEKERSIVVRYIFKKQLERRQKGI